MFSQAINCRSPNQWTAGHRRRGATRLSFVGRGVDLVAQGHSPLLRIRFAQGQRAGRHGDLADRFFLRALDLIARLRESERLSAQNCAEREHLCGCGPLPAGA